MLSKWLKQEKRANKIDDVYDQAIAYRNNVREYFELIRKHVDKLEMLVDDEMWPLPKYRELLFIK